MGQKRITLTMNTLMQVVMILLPLLDRTPAIHEKINMTNQESTKITQINVEEEVVGVKVEAVGQVTKESMMSKLCNQGRAAMTRERIFWAGENDPIVSAGLHTVKGEVIAGEGGK
eukprot:2678875-Ditylum_brightwellii.AAC.1